MGLGGVNKHGVLASTVAQISFKKFAHGSDPIHQLGQCIMSQKGNEKTSVVTQCTGVN